ncbi:MAG TPA: GNAT family N-acetyltransferase [Blastocatellia bacterium]|nr:GNAT family N-acetyltransferase [Blastocatellia bacterium]
MNARRKTKQRIGTTQPYNESLRRTLGERPQSHVAVCKELTADEEPEVLDFLAQRPAHTFGMAGFIRANGLVSPHNRGKFYACRDEAGALEGVALIGHFVLFEARDEAVIAAFARLAQDCHGLNMLLGEAEKVQTFWRYYSQRGRPARLHCRELLLELRWPMEVHEEAPGMRLATIDDLDLIVPAHAQSAFDDSGVDPLQTDPVGFRQRCARRIEQAQTWVWVEGGKLLFKAEIITDTPEVVYLEGVWVNPSERHKGYGLRCMSQLGMTCLKRTGSVCLLVNEQFQAAQAFYKRAGYKFVSHYDTIFLKQDAN